MVMKVSIFLFSFFVILTGIAKAQISCPLGYQLRNVKCLNSPSMTQECIPANYTCNSCWQVEWPYCNGSNNKGYENASTYEDALKVAEYNKSHYESCKGSSGLDYNNYRIFIAGGDYCKTNGLNNNSNGTSNNSGGTNSQTTSDLSNNNTKNNLNSDSKKEIDNLKSTFYTVSYTKALSKLNTIKQANPQKAGDYTNTYWPKINYYEQIFTKEYNKGDNANLSMLRQYIRELDNLVEKMGLTGDTDKQSNDNQKQQYQNQPNVYLNNAKDNNQNGISQQLNLDLAKANAIMTGSQKEVQEINRLQYQQQQANNQEVLQSGLALASNLYSLLNSKESIRSQMQREQKERKMENELKASEGDVNAIYWEGTYAYLRKDYKKAEYWYKRAADSGDLNGMHHLASLYRLYLINDSLAKYWYTKAANAGNIQSMLDLADEYYLTGGHRRDGSQIKPDCEKNAIALSYYLLVDTLDYKYAGTEPTFLALSKVSTLLNIGNIYKWCRTDGLSDHESLQKALYWYDKCLNSCNESYDMKGNYGKFIRKDIESSKKEIFKQLELIK
jgi:TPR repeat protein